MELKIRDGDRIILTNSKFRVSDYINFQMKPEGKKKKKEQDREQMKFGEENTKLYLDV